MFNLDNLDLYPIIPLMSLGGHFFNIKPIVNIIIGIIKKIIFIKITSYFKYSKNKYDEIDYGFIEKIKKILSTIS